MTTNQLITKIGRQRVVTALFNTVCSGSGGAEITQTITDGDTTHSPSGDAVFDALALKQDVLASGTNIKTINSNSLLGSGNISVSTLLGFNPSRRILYRVNSSATGLTGTTNETLLDSYLIPAGTIEENDWIEVTMMFTRANGGLPATLTNRLRVHTLNQVSGATLIANAWTINSGQTTQQARRTIKMKNSLSSQEIFPSGASTESDLSVTASSFAALSQNFANDQYIIVSGQLGNSGDTLVLRSWMIELIRQ